MKIQRMCRNDVQFECKKIDLLENKKRNSNQILGLLTFMKGIIINDVRILGEGGGC